MTKPLVERALTELVEAEGARYASVWDELSPRQRALAIALTRERGEIFSESYRRRHKLGSPGSVRSALERLIQRELVESTHPGYAIADPFLPVWIRRPEKD